MDRKTASKKKNDDFDDNSNEIQKDENEVPVQKMSLRPDNPGGSALATSTDPDFFDIK